MFCLKFLIFIFPKH